MKTRTGNLFKRNGTYYVRWRVNGKLFMRSTGETQLKEAKTKRDEILAPFLAGREVDVLRNVSARIAGRTSEIEQWEEKENPPLEVTDAWAAYVKALNRPDSGPETLRQYQGHWRQFAAWIGEEHATVTELRDVSKQTSEEYAQHLVERGLSPNSFNKHLNFLALLYRVLRDKARMQGRDNPWSHIRRKRLATHSRRELTTDELRAVCEAASGEMRLLFGLGIYTGLRLGDCATLRWSEVDLSRGIIHRVPNKTGRRKSVPVAVPVHHTLRSLLADAPRDDCDHYVLPGHAQRYLRDRASVTKIVQKHFAECGIPTLKPGTGPGTGSRAVVEVGFHSLRHTFVSLCREANAPLAVVEAIVGHSNPAVRPHYANIGRAPAGIAVAALPDITRQPHAEAPKPAETATVPAAEVRRLAEGMTPKTWRKLRGELLALATDESKVTR